MPGFVVGVGDKTFCPADVHNIDHPPQLVTPEMGVLETGSLNVRVNGRFVVCLGDTGSHIAPFCIGPNTVVVGLSNNPIGRARVNGRLVAYLGDMTLDCVKTPDDPEPWPGSPGTIISASNVRM